MFKGLARRIKNQFVTGLIVILPIGLTAWIVWVLFRLIGNRFLPLFENFPAITYLPLSAQMAISAALTIVVIWTVGILARNFIGRMFFRLFEKLLYKTPVISNIYKTVRRITDTIFADKQSFKRVALIEYPRRGIYTLVFVTNDIESRKGDNLVSVFVPSTPNPTTGYCILLPREDVRIIPISVNQAMEFIFSAGIIVPKGYKFPRMEVE
jgi:uncharacterized membrane protein